MNLDCAFIQVMLAKNEPFRMSEALAQHLSACAACAALWDARSGVKSLLQRALANNDAAPVALRVRIRRELRRPPTRWQRALSWFAGMNKSWMLATATASATLLALFQGRTYNLY